ncbi:hypothetical protein KW797_03530, partial [Candidatus Parcubacteria bacterium]|nr:hypothetical protein [Candidatus Parcubacteria bacterium]
MQLTVRTEDLRAALKKTKLTVSPTDSNVVLQNFALRAENDEITLIATDLQLATVCVVPATVTEPGTTTLPGIKLISIVDHASSDVMTLKVDTGRQQATITAGEYVAQLVTLSFDDYPKLEDFKQEDVIKTDRALFAEKLDRISFSVCDNESKRNLLNVFINAGLMQATDSRVTTVIEFDSNFTDTLIPALAVKDLIKVLRASNVQEVELCATASFLLFRLGKDLFMTRLAAAKFPDIPKKVIAPT